MVEYKTPDYVILEDPEEEHRGKKVEDALKLFQRIREFYNRPFSLGQSIVCLIIGLAVAVWTGLLFWVVVFCAGAAGLALGNNDDLNNNLKQSIVYFQKMLVISLGLLLMVFSPALGVSLIYTHSLLRNGTLESSWFDRILRQRN